MILLLLIVAGMTTTFAQSITVPRTPSPAATVVQTVGISKITINYSRPSVKGRQVWGTLVPYGYTKIASGADAPWRAGANENTTIEFTHDAKVEGKSVPAGKYGLFFVINADNTGEVILSKDNRSWGHFFYNPANDLMRAPITIKENAMTENLTYEFTNLSKNGTELVLNWEKKQFPVKIEFAVDQIVMANANEELRGQLGFMWQGYASAAGYAAANKINNEQAMKWIDQALTQNKSFPTLQVKSQLLRQSGQTAEADKTLKEAVAVATENELNAFGYQLLGIGQHDRAIEMLTLNTEKHPESANCWDSLGEAYATKGDNKNAIKNFRKALTLNPNDATRANSEKFLKQLQGN